MKILSVYIALIITGGVFLSSVSADDSVQTTTTAVEDTSTWSSDSSVSSDDSTQATTTDVSSIESSGSVSDEATDSSESSNSNESSATGTTAIVNTDDIGSTTCKNVGTRSEGLYFPNGKLYKWTSCWKEMKQGCFAPGSCGQGLPPFLHDIGKPLMPSRELGGFLKNSLTKEEQDAVIALLRAQQLERDIIMDDTSLTWEEKVTKMIELTNVHITAILTYINNNEQDLFRKIMEERMSTMAKNKEIRKEEGGKKQEIKKEVQAKKKALSDKLHGQLIKAIEKLPQTKLEKVLSNIDKAVTKVTTNTLDQTKKDRFLAQLEEIRTIIQEKIDVLTGNTSEELNLGEILEETADTVTQ